MNRYVAISVSVMFLTLFALFATADNRPGADANALFSHIQRADYTDWHLWPGKGRLAVASKPHGERVTTYMNDAAMTALKNGTPMRDGAIIVKENYDSDRKLTGIDVMYKLAGYSSGGGDWYWASYSETGRVLASGKGTSCVECHGKAASNDWVFSGNFIN